MTADRVEHGGLRQGPAVEVAPGYPLRVPLWARQTWGSLVVVTEITCATGRFEEHTEWTHTRWTAEDKGLRVYVGSITDDPDAHGRLLTMVREELMSQGIKVDEKDVAP